MQSDSSILRQAKVGTGKTMQKYRKNRIIYVQGEEADQIFYVQSEKVKVTVVSEEGKEAVVGILDPGQFLVRDASTARAADATAKTVSRGALFGALAFLLGALAAFFAGQAGAVVPISAARAQAALINEARCIAADSAGVRHQSSLPTPAATSTGGFSEALLDSRTVLRFAVKNEKREHELAPSPQGFLRGSSLIFLGLVLAVTWSGFARSRH